MLRWSALIVLGACSASVDGGGGADPDAPPRSNSTDASPDALPCTGGDVSGTAPDGSCLQLFTGKQTFADAKLACETVGSHLAILNTQALDTFAEGLVKTNDTFIGLSDLAVEMQFRWVDDTALTFSAWNPTEPNDGDATYDEDCAIIAGARVTKQWDDRPCAPTTMFPNAGSYAYLCQR